MKRVALYLTIIFFLTAVSCSSHPEDYYIKHPTEGPPNNYSYDPNWTSVPQPTDANGVALPGKPYDYINPERVYNIGEWMDIAGVQIRLNSVEFTKKLGNMKLECMVTQRTCRNDLVDEEGNIYGDESYVIMSIDIQNQNEEAVKICVGDFGLYQQILDERQEVTKFCYMEPSMYESPDSNFYLMQPGEKITFMHYSIIEDADIDDKVLYFHVPSWNIPTVPIEADDSYYGYAVWVPINKDKGEVDIYEKYRDEQNYMNPARIYNVGETIERDGMSFCVNNIYEGKELEGISVNQMRYDDYTKKRIDSEGTFDTDEYGRHYMRVNVTIKNLTSEARKLCTSVIYLSEPCVGGISTCATTGVTPSITTDLFYADFYSFQPGEEMTFDLYYICLDSNLTAENQVLYFPMNMELQDEDNPKSFYDYDIFVSLKKDKNEVNIYGE